MGRDRAGRPVRCPSSLALRQGFWQSMQRHAHPAGMKRDPYFAAQGGSGSADAATTRCRGVRKQHQIPGGGLVSDDQHYDVIVIGSGAGGGTLTHRLAPTGKRVLLLERGDYLPASGPIGTRPRYSSMASTALRNSGWTTMARSSHPRSTTTSAGTRNSTELPCSDSDRRTSAKSSISVASLRPGPSTTRTSSRTTPKLSTCI